jgi:hypothetical protein
MRSILADSLGVLRNAALGLFHFLVGNDSARMRYRPEAHYMRGPGPKWREKHGLDRSRGS